MNTILMYLTFPTKVCWVLTGIYMFWQSAEKSQQEGGLERLCGVKGGCSEDIVIQHGQWRI